MYTAIVPKLARHTKRKWCTNDYCRVWPLSNPLLHRGLTTSTPTKWRSGASCRPLLARGTPRGKLGLLLQLTQPTIASPFPLSLSLSLPPSLSIPSLPFPIPLPPPSLSIPSLSPSPSPSLSIPSFPLPLSLSPVPRAWPEAAC